MPRDSSQSKQIEQPLVVVAGGAGFLGSHLSEALLRSGARVLAVDTFSTGRREAIESFRHHPKYQFFEYDINQGLPKVFHDMPISHIVYAPSETYAKNESAHLSSLLACSFGVKNLLDLATAKHARVVIGSSTHIYDGLVSSTRLSDYFGGTTEEEMQYAQLESMRYAEMLGETYARSFNLDVRVARLSQVYGPRMELPGETLLALLLEEALKGEDLRIETEGSREVLVTYVSDAVFGLMQLLFADDEQFYKSIYQFANPERVSVLSIAYTLRNYLPKGKEVIFLPRHDYPILPTPKLSVDRTRRDLSWEPLIDLTEGLRRTMDWLQKERTGGTVHQSAIDEGVRPGSLPAIKTDLLEPALPDKGDSAKKDESKKKPDTLQPSRVGSTQVRRQWWKRLLLSGVAIAVYMSIGQPVVHGSVEAAVAGWQLKGGLSQAKELHFSQARQSFQSAKGHFTTALTLARSLQGRVGLVGKPVFLQQIAACLEAAQQTSGGLAVLAEAGLHLSQVTDGQVVGQKENVAESLQMAHENLRLARINLTTAQGLLAGGSGDVRVAGARFQNGKEVQAGGWLSRPMETSSNLLSEVVTLLSRGDEIVALAPELLGTTQPKSYLILLQNSDELRPTGGRVSHYILVRMNAGQSSLTVENLNELNQHAGMIAPSPFVQQFHDSNVMMQDANWSPDVVSSAKQEAAMFTADTGVHVDGVGFMTLQGLAFLFGQRTSLTLADFPEKVTAANLTDLARHYESRPEVVQNQDPDFIDQVVDSLAQTYQGQGTAGTVRLVTGLLQGLRQHELQVYSTSQQVEAYFDMYGWSGKMVAGSGDYLQVVEANLGLNRVNSAVQRQTTYTATLDENGALRGETDIAWTNTSKTAAWPEGDYLAYVRVYVPAGSVLRHSEGAEGSWVSGFELGKTVFSGWVRVPYGVTKHVKLGYDLPDSVHLSDDSMYHLVWQKQAGVHNDKLQVLLHAPSSMQVISPSEEAQKTNNGIEWRFDPSNDVEVTATVTPLRS